MSRVRSTLRCDTRSTGRAGLRRSVGFATTAPVGGADEPTVWRSNESQADDGQDRGEPTRKAFGRYQLEAQIGAGGMGVVYRAYDPMLERRVALKIVRPRLEGAAAQRRLFREAQALAQVRHPNVVAVHDVGVLGQDVFVAMELVEGTPLLEWQRDRDAGEILRAYLEAGRGLAAAHAQGLVHRDVKPSNILIDTTGRVTVIDFGLAAITDEELTDRDQDQGDETTLETSSCDGLGRSMLTDPLTEVGVVLGTPRYMAPEQHAFAVRGDTQTDQYSFAVCLYEALTGGRAFAIRDADESSRARLRMLVGAKVRESFAPPPSSSMSAHVRRTLERAMSVDPKRRFPTMAALLGALSTDPLRRRRRAVLAAVVAAMFAGTTFVAARAGTAPSLCRGADAEFSNVWNPSVRTTMAAAFAATEMSYAGDSFERVARAIDRYGDQWVAMREEACTATHIRGTQSDRLLDARMSCLDRRIDEVGALVAVLISQTDAETVEKAHRAAFALTPVAGCANERTLTAAVPPPDNPKERRRVEALTRRLVRAQALMAMGRYPEGLSIVHELSRPVEDTGYEPLVAARYLLAAKLQEYSGDDDAAEEAMRLAVLHGSRARDDDLVVDAWTIALSLADKRMAYSDGLSIVGTVRAAAARAGDNPVQLGLIEQHVGALHGGMGDFELAIESQRRGLALLEEVLPEDDARVVRALSDLSNTYYRAGMSTEARDLDERALALRERAVGPKHPEFAVALYNLATSFATAREYQRAEEGFSRALELFLLAYGKEHAYTESAYHALGSLHLQQGFPQKAETFARHSLDLREKRLGPKNPRTVLSRMLVGSIRHSLADYEEAEAALGQAIADWEEHYGPDHPEVVGALQTLAANHAEKGDIATARALYQKALSVALNRYGPEDRRVANVEKSWGTRFAELGYHVEALEHLERALDVYRQATASSYYLRATQLSIVDALLERGQTEKAATLLEGLKEFHGDDADARYIRALSSFYRARILWSTPADRSRALHLAREARDIFASSDADYRERRSLPAVEAWMRTRNH